MVRSMPSFSHLDESTLLNFLGDTAASDRRDASVHLGASTGSVSTAIMAWRLLSLQNYTLI